MSRVVRVGNSIVFFRCFKLIFDFLSSNAQQRFRALGRVGGHQRIIPPTLFQNGLKFATCKQRRFGGLTRARAIYSFEDVLLAVEKPCIAVVQIFVQTFMQNAFAIYEPFVDAKNKYRTSNKLIAMELDDIGDPANYTGCVMSDVSDQFREDRRSKLVFADPCHQLTCVLIGPAIHGQPPRVT